MWCFIMTEMTTAVHLALDGGWTFLVFQRPALPLTFGTLLPGGILRAGARLPAGGGAARWVAPPTAGPARWPSALRLPR